MSKQCIDVSVLCEVRPLPGVRRGLLNRLLPLVLLASLSLSAHSVLAQAPAVSGFDLAWLDEFDGMSIDSSKWDVADTNVPTNNSLQDYLPDQVSVSGGNLVITAENSASRGLPYVSGSVISKVAQQYGRWEVRANLPTGKGMWPAIWLLSDTTKNAWPSQGEIDIMENRGDQPNLTSSAFHYGTNPPFSHQFVAKEQQSVAGGSQVNYHNSFHNYAVEWDNKQIRFYVDDVHHATVRDSDTGGFISRQSDGMNVILNLAVGGDFLDNPDASTPWPQDFRVDHVYAYTKADSDPVMTFDNGSFDDNGGSLAHWSTYGNTIGAGTNVRGDNQHVASGDGALKLYGQFDGTENYSGVEQGLTVTGGETLFAQASAFVDSNDSIFATDNYAVLNIDYYNQQYGEFGSGQYIGSDSVVLADGATLNDVWLTRQLSSVVPDGAVEARLALVFVQPQFAGGAVHIDSVRFFSAAAVPEPSTLWMLVAITGLCFVRRKSRSFSAST
ncbi:Glucan endo-1,3-beta-glucosidase A1 precursor [Rubripirellula tenax]|uniref:Glucan endo-1,3-beta-glucosidase A1 n=1 Tax=Rubripirellula tenax TaxID=2528015 RepID=A0A5C6ETV9_9BACT|nr:family 16 glycosylhydrolase [Rubripirellula tenax]TWU51036.1 Glucan endo-1,3-beta-glucosidase A1 precursor [Rubripirellula tenax]